MIGPSGQHPRVHAGAIGFTPHSTQLVTKFPLLARKRLTINLLFGYLQWIRADAGTRTPDPFITSEVLYQLSYVGGVGSV